MLTVFGNRQVVLCRELTKIHEEYLRGSIEELLDYIEEHPVKGECCLLVEGNTGSEEPQTQIEGSLKEQVEQLIALGEKTNAAIKAVAVKNGLKSKKYIDNFTTWTSCIEKDIFEGKLCPNCIGKNVSFLVMTI